MPSRGRLTSSDREHRHHTQLSGGRWLGAPLALAVAGCGMADAPRCTFFVAGREGELTCSGSQSRWERCLCVFTPPHVARRRVRSQNTARDSERRFVWISKDEIIAEHAAAAAGTHGRCAGGCCSSNPSPAGRLGAALTTMRSLFPRSWSCRLETLASGVRLDLARSRSNTGSKCAVASDVAHSAIQLRMDDSDARGRSR